MELNVVENESKEAYISPTVSHGMAEDRILAVGLRLKHIPCSGQGHNHTRRSNLERSDVRLLSPSRQLNDWKASS